MRNDRVPYQWSLEQTLSIKHAVGRLIYVRLHPDSVHLSTTDTALALIDRCRIRLIWMLLLRSFQRWGSRTDSTVYHKSLLFSSYTWRARTTWIWIHYRYYFWYLLVEGLYWGNFSTFDEANTKWAIMSFPDLHHLLQIHIRPTKGPLRSVPLRHIVSETVPQFLLPIPLFFGQELEGRPTWYESHLGPTPIHPQFVRSSHVSYPASTI